MKVRYVTDIFSLSTSTAIEYLKNTDYVEFQGSEETMKYFRIIDRHFDFLNPCGKGFKKPVYPDDIDFLEKSLTPMVQYLFKLKDKSGKLIHLDPRKTFVIGFAASFKSTVAIVRHLFQQSTSLKYFLTNFVSQDHVEVTFSRIRGRCGFNNNPNAIQLKSAMKQIIVKNVISTSTAANRAALDLKPYGDVCQIRRAPKKGKIDANCAMALLQENSDDEEEDGEEIGLYSHSVVKIFKIIEDYERNGNAETRKNIL